MPQDEYSPLKELVLFPRLDVVVTLADICHTDRVPLASSLLRIFRFDPDQLLFLNTYYLYQVWQKRGGPSDTALSIGDRERGGDIDPFPRGLAHHHSHGRIHEKRLWWLPPYSSIPNYSQVRNDQKDSSCTVVGQFNSQGHWSFTCVGSWRQSRAVSSIRARLRVQLKRVPMQSSCFRSNFQSTSRFNFMIVCRCWMTSQNLSSCQARRVPAHCATFVLAYRGMFKTGAEISLDFAWILLLRWPQERLVKTRVVSGFIFLRLLCPAILNPRQACKTDSFLPPWSSV